MLSKVSFRNLARFAGKSSLKSSWQRYHMQVFSQVKMAQVSLLSKSFSNFSTLNEQTQTTQLSWTELKPKINSVIENIDKQSWDDVIRSIEQIVLNLNDISPEKVTQFFTKVESKLLTDDTSSIHDEVIVELAYYFGVNKIGSKDFWDKLVLKATNRALPVLPLSRFVYGYTNISTVNTQIFEEIHQHLTENPSDITPELVCYLLPSILRNSIAVNSQTTTNPNIQTHFTSDKDLAKIPLWNLLKDVTIEYVEHFGADELVEIAFLFSSIKHREQGFWTSVESRAKELQSQFEERHIVTLVQALGAIKEGSSDFWQEIESYVIENLDDLHTSSLVHITRGFAQAEEGSFRFWNGLSSHFIKTDLEEKELASVIHSLGQYQLLNIRKWEEFEAKIFERIPEFSAEGILELVMGLSKRGDKVSSKLWNSVEERTLELEDLPKQLQLMLYVTFKTVNRLTPSLTNHFQDIAPSAEQFIEASRKYRPSRSQN